MGKTETYEGPSFGRGGGKGGAPHRVPVQMRNLEELGGVIFGCTKDTIRECLEGKVFGLPSIHFQYVQYIEEGMPLFLFNYSDRKMYGIFEAASEGQMDINPEGWMRPGDRGKTKYPAQVRAHQWKKCPPLIEAKFRNAIQDNYYSSSHFMFELTAAQAAELCGLFHAEARRVEGAISSARPAAVVPPPVPQPAIPLPTNTKWAGAAKPAPAAAPPAAYAPPNPYTPHAGASSSSSGNGAVDKDWPVQPAAAVPAGPKVDAAAEQAGLEQHRAHGLTSAASMQDVVTTVEQHLVVCAAAVSQLREEMSLSQQARQDGAARVAKLEVEKEQLKVSLEATRKEMHLQGQQIAFLMSQLKISKAAS